MSKPQVYHAANIKYLQDAAAEHLAKARRAMQARTVEWHHNAARERHDEITRYMAFFGIRRKVAPFPAAAWASSALARATSIETPDPVRDAKRYKAQQARAKATAAHFAEKREAWRSGAGDTLADMTRSERQQWRSMPCMLRVQGDEIVTSQGARIPVAHAPRLWARIQRAVIGEPYTANGRSEHAGQFKVDSINTAGTLRAGCHTIKYDELALLARTLNLEVAA